MHETNLRKIKRLNVKDQEEIETLYSQVTHRMRRGKLVEIPEEWRGKVPHDQTMRKRNPISKRTTK